jgi:ribosomal protein S18 acetylase RimI-like enzyme
MSIKLVEMNNDEFLEYSKFSYQNYIDEYMTHSKSTLREAQDKVGFFDIKRTENDLWFLVVFNNTTIGYVWIQVNTIKQDAFYYDVYLNKDHRGKGHGRSLMNQTQSLLIQKNIKSLRLSVFQDNLSAKKLYDSLGYHVVMTNDDANTFRMQLDL